MEGRWRAKRKTVAKGLLKVRQSKQAKSKRETTIEGELTESMEWFRRYVQ